MNTKPQPEAMSDGGLERALSKLEIATCSLQGPQPQTQAERAPTLVDLPVEIIEQIVEILFDYPCQEDKDLKTPLQNLRLSSAKLAAKTERLFCNKYFKSVSAIPGKDLFNLFLKLADHEIFRLYVKTAHINLKFGSSSEGKAVDSSGMSRYLEAAMGRFINLTDLTIIDLNFQFQETTIFFRFQYLGSLVLDDAVGNCEDFIDILRNHPTLEKVDFSRCTLWYGCWNDVLDTILLLPNLRHFELYKAREHVDGQGEFTVIYASTGEQIEQGKPDCLLISNGANYYTITAPDKHGMHESISYMMHHHSLRDHLETDDAEDLRR